MSKQKQAQNESTINYQIYIDGVKYIIVATDLQDAQVKAEALKAQLAQN